MRAWWQNDASATASQSGTAGTIDSGVVQQPSDDPPTLTKKAQQYTDLDVVKVEIIDDQGSFVSEDPRKAARVQLTLSQIMGGDETSFVPLRLTVGTSSDDGNNNHTAGEWLNVTDGQYSPRPLTMGMSTDAIVDAPAVGDIEPAPGTTVFVGMQIYAPATGTYEVVLAVDEQGCTASCTEIGCCQHDPPSTWSEAIAANAMDAIPEFRLRLNILTGDMSVLHTEVKVREDLLESGVATYTPVQNLELQLQAKDSAGNVRTQRGDAFQMRLCMQEGELACGSYVTPNNTANQKTYSPDEASLWCGAAACPGPQVNGEPAACGPGESRAKMIGARIVSDTLGAAR